MFELAGHFDISIGLTLMLVADSTAGQVGRDRASFFIFPRSEVAPVVYDYAYTMVEGKTPAQMPGVLAETFAKTVEESRAAGPDNVGSGYYALMRLDEFVASRVVEAVVHGLDLTDALGRPPMATPAGMPPPPPSSTSCARRTVAGRPADLADDLAWVRAASGRAEHPDPGFPSSAEQSAASVLIKAPELAGRSGSPSTPRARARRVIRAKSGPNSSRSTPGARQPQA